MDQQCDAYITIASRGDAGSLDERGLGGLRMTGTHDLSDEQAF
jgi:hypothetical protein